MDMQVVHGRDEQPVAEINDLCFFPLNIVHCARLCRFACRRTLSIERSQVVRHTKDTPVGTDTHIAILQYLETAWLLCK